MLKIAIIGAGFTGLTLANTLKDVAHVSVFEKARGVGGRMSTRYADPYYFDHGVPTFTARSPQFQAYLAPLIHGGLVTPWAGKVVTLEAGKKTTKRMWFEPHYVASPNMNSLCKHLADTITVQVNTEIAPLGEKHADGWHLIDKNGVHIGVFDLVISTAPAAQTATLFAGHASPDVFQQAQMVGCYTLMIGFNRPWEHQWIAAKVHNSPLKWVYVNSTKPGRNAALTTCVVHTHNDWAEVHINDDMKEAESYLVSQFEMVTGISCTTADYISTHRWRYAVVAPRAQDAAQHNMKPYFDAARGLAASSDWCSGADIEAVWDNAQNLSHQIINSLTYRT